MTYKVCKFMSKDQVKKSNSNLMIIIIIEPPRHNKCIYNIIYVIFFYKIL